MLTTVSIKSFVVRIGLVFALGCILANNSRVDAPYTVQVSQLNVEKNITHKSSPIYQPSIGVDFSKVAVVK